MKIAVPAFGPTLDDKVDPAFGRSRYYLIVETDDLSFEAVESQHRDIEMGAGIRSARLIVEKGARTVLTGIWKLKFHRPMQAAGVEVIRGVSGQVREVVEQFKRGELSPFTKEWELDFLKGHSRFVEDTIALVKKRIQELEPEVKEA